MKEKTEIEKEANMRIVHHSTMIEHGSGMMRQVRDLVAAECRRGLDSGVICTQESNKTGIGADGKPLAAYGLELKPWKWAYELDEKDTVHVIHSHPPVNLCNLKNSVTVLHGTPEHVVFRQLWTKTNAKHIPHTTSVNLINSSDMAVTLIPRHKQYWDAFAHRDQVVAVDGGVDLEEFKPDWMLTDEERAAYKAKNVMPVFPFSAKPSIFICESYYEIKVPTVVLLAIKQVVKTLPRARLSIINLKGVEGFWLDFVRKSYIDQLCDLWQPNKVMNLETYYRGATVYASPVLMGDVSRCAMEALGCGTPVVGVKAKENYLGKWSADHNPNDFADKIIDIHAEMESDELKTRQKARMIAEQNYDIDRTVYQMEERVYNKLVGA